TDANRVTERVGEVLHLVDGECFRVWNERRTAEGAQRIAHLRHRDRDVPRVRRERFHAVLVFPEIHRVVGPNLSADHRLPKVIITQRLSVVAPDVLHERGSLVYDWNRIEVGNGPDLFERPDRWLRRTTEQCAQDSPHWRDMVSRSLGRLSYEAGNV